MTVATPHKGTYAIQGLRITDSLPDAPVSMGANRPSGGATLTPVVRGDDNTAALFLNLYREQEPPPNSEHDWHYLEATADMRKVTLKIWASQNPTYTTGRIQVWTWLPGVLAAKKIGERALNDYRTEGNAIRVLVGAVLKGQRFLIFATDAPSKPDRVCHRHRRPVYQLGRKPLRRARLPDGHPRSAEGTACARIRKRGAGRPPESSPSPICPPCLPGYGSAFG